MPSIHPPLPVKAVDAPRPPRAVIGSRTENRRLEGRSDVGRVETHAWSDECGCGRSRRGCGRQLAGASRQKRQHHPLCLRSGVGKHRPVFQQRPPRRHYQSRGLGYADLPRPIDQRIQAAVGHRVEMGRRQNARVEAARGSEVPQRRGVRRRRRGLHAEFHRRCRQQSDSPAERQLDREGRKNRQIHGAPQDQTPIPGGDRVPDRADRDVPERISRQGRPQGHEREAGRHRSLQGHRERDRQGHQARTQQRVLGRIAKAEAGNREARNPHDPGPPDADRGNAVGRPRSDHECRRRAGRPDEGRAPPRRDGRCHDAHRIPADEHHAGNADCSTA